MYVKRAMAAVAATALLAPATAAAVAPPPPGPGQSASAPGTQVALERCLNTVDRQTERGVTAGGGPKTLEPAPTNCDHFWQGIGAIGGGGS